MKTKRIQYELIEHTADLGVIFYGDDPAALYECATMALMELMVDQPPMNGRHEIVVEADGIDPPDLFVSYLNELLYYFQVKGLIATNAHVEDLTDETVRVRITAADYNIDVHGVNNDIKAATYHQVVFEPYEDQWRARVVFDL